MSPLSLLPLSVNCQPCDLALVDLCVLEIDGLALIPRLRTAAHPPGRIVALSASVFPIDRTRAVAAGADEFLPKPVQSSVPHERRDAVARPPFPRRPG